MLRKYCCKLVLCYILNHYYLYILYVLTVPREIIIVFTTMILMIALYIDALKHCLNPSNGTRTSPPPLRHLDG